MKRCIVLGVTGGIAAYKACELVSRFVKAGFDVRCVLTQHAAEFVAPLTFETLSGNPAVVSMWDRVTSWEVEHISLAQRADLFLVAPCTANLLAKYAAGIADDFLSTTLLATRAPVLLCPAMNTAMWEHVATRENVNKLAARGVHFVQPGRGRLACGDIGEGKLADVETIYEQALRLLHAERDMEGRRVLVTAGATREMLDPVRYLTNRSSGKMGYALAEAARERGADVTLVSGPTALETPAGVRRVDILSTEELLQAVLEAAPHMDAVVQAAAPADYRPRVMEAQKIKKQKGEPLVLELVETPDVAARLGAEKKPGQVLVTFAAETQAVLENAREKRARKNADLMVANDITRPGAGFEGDTNIVTLIDAQGNTDELPLLTKREVADAIWDRVVRIWH